MCTEQVRLLKDYDNRSPAIDLKNNYKCDNLALKRERNKQVLAGTGIGDSGRNERNV